VNLPPFGRLILARVRIVNAKHGGVFGHFRAISGVGRAENASEPVEFGPACRYWPN
jgi:hypothetical protein